MQVGKWNAVFQWLGTRTCPIPPLPNLFQRRLPPPPMRMLVCPSVPHFNAGRGHWRLSLSHAFGRFVCSGRFCHTYFSPPTPQSLAWPCILSAGWKHISFQSQVFFASRGVKNGQKTSQKLFFSLYNEQFFGRFVPIFLVPSLAPSQVSSSRGTPWGRSATSLFPASSNFQPLSWNTRPPGVIGKALIHWNYQPRTPKEAGKLCSFRGATQRQGAPEGVSGLHPGGDEGADRPAERHSCSREATGVHGSRCLLSLPWLRFVEDQFCNFVLYPSVHLPCEKVLWFLIWFLLNFQVSWCQISETDLRNFDTCYVWRAPKDPIWHWTGPYKMPVRHQVVNFQNFKVFKALFSVLKVFWAIFKF